MPKESTKILLSEKDMPKQWYNILPDLPGPIKPPVSPQTGKPVTPDELGAIFPPDLIEQEMSPDQFIDIPEEVLNIYRLWRPAPLFRARRLEEALKTPAKIFYKYEGVSPAGSHKLNTAIAQAYYNKKAGINKLSTETGAGQWGSAMSLAGQFFDIDVHVYMVKVSYFQKPYRKFMMETWGGKVDPSPSELTNTGREILAKDPENPGNLSIAISEAVEEAAMNPDINYTLGSVLNHVCLHQTVIGLESQKQLEMVGEYPDVVIGCVGGGSNFAGIAFPFIRDKINGKQVEFLAVEPSACPTLTKGKFCYDYGDEAKMAPIVEMYTLGHTFMPPGIHAGGLRYHGMSPLVSYLKHEGLINAISLHQNECFKAAVDFSRIEGIIPAPESSHAVRAAIIEAEKAREEGKEKTILFNLSGHGHFDLASYEKYLNSELNDYEYPEALINEALQDLPDVKL
ncbi:MAG: TrpB-like pyridoxal phosphate-dependent enzyme [bacterium]|nr:TrpB-like pyridoxal phosphate-dependent enzyme [bacterium]